MDYTRFLDIFTDSVEDKKLDNLNKLFSELVEDPNIKNSIAFFNKQKIPIILYAIYFDVDENLIRQLILQGADVNIPFVWHYEVLTPIGAALIKKNHDLVSLLIDNNADVNDRFIDRVYISRIIRSLAMQDETTIEVYNSNAIFEKGMKKIFMPFASEKDAVINRIKLYLENEPIWTPLAYAIYLQDKDLIKKLLEGSNIDLNLQFKIQKDILNPYVFSLMQYADFSIFLFNKVNIDAKFVFQGSEYDMQSLIAQYHANNTHPLSGLVKNLIMVSVVNISHLFVNYFHNDEKTRIMVLQHIKDKNDIDIDILAFISVDKFLLYKIKNTITDTNLLTADEKDNLLNFFKVEDFLKDESKLLLFLQNIWYGFLSFISEYIYSFEWYDHQVDLELVKHYTSIFDSKDAGLLGNSEVTNTNLDVDSI